MNGVPWYVALGLIVVLLFVAWDDYQVRGRIKDGRVDTLLTTRMITLTPAPIFVETTKAYLSLRQSLKRTKASLAQTQTALATISSMYENAMRDTGAIELPTAILDTTIQRKNSARSDTLHTEYVFPPVNAFVNTRISLAPFNETFQDTNYTKTIVLPPSFWVKAEIFTVGVAAGVVIIGVLHYIK